VDLVLPPGKIGDGLQTALKYPHLIINMPQVKDLYGIGTILDMIHQKTGVDYSEYKISTIHRRVSRRLAIHQLENLSDYIAHIKNLHEELVALSKDMLIAVRSIFFYQNNNQGIIRFINGHGSRKALSGSRSVEFGVWRLLPELVELPLAFVHHQSFTRQTDN
jgi:hypothetical protein